MSFVLSVFNHNFRLLFMADGSSSYEQVTRLLDIASVDKYQHYYVLPPGEPALRIIQKGWKLSNCNDCVVSCRTALCCVVVLYCVVYTQHNVMYTSDRCLTSFAPLFCRQKSKSVLSLFKRGEEPLVFVS